MATPSAGLQQRTRQKTAPAFPRERQQQQQQQPAHSSQTTPVPHPTQQQQQQQQQNYFHSSHQQAYYAPQQHALDLEAWRLQQALQSLPMTTPPLPSATSAPSQSRRPSRGPRTLSPTVMDSQSRVLNWENHQSPHYQQPSSHQHFRRKSITSTTSSSDHRPSHHHHHLRSPGRRDSRSPSPGTPRTFSSSRPPRTPMAHSGDKRGRKMTNGGVSNSSASANGAAGGCVYETALVNSRRRIPYSVGAEPLQMVPPGQYLQRLDEKDERCLTVEIMDLYQQLLPTEDTEERRRLFIDKLAKILRREFPNSYSQVHVFGSSENRLGTNSSDVDVCVVTTTKDMDDTCMLASILHSNNFEKVVCVAQAKVAVVKIWDAEFQIQCDINVNNSLAIENTRLVKVYVDIDERVRPLAMIIKYWAKSRMLNDAAGGGTLTSYTWILMVINFLQTREPPILPALQRLPHLPRMSNGIDVGFFDDVASLKDYGAENTESVGQLLYAFFVKFAYQFDYNRDVISVRTGGYLLKEEKGWHLMQNNSLCVEEPFNTKRNLGNTADEATIKGLQLEFRRAVHYLADHLALDSACWPYSFPTSENPRPERHLPNLPPHCRQTASSSWKKSSYSQRYNRPQNSGSPPFKSPKPRDEDPSAFMNQRNFSSFAGSRQHPYPFNPLTLNPPLPPPQHMPSTVPNTPASSTMSSAMSPATAGGDIHHAYPPTPVDQLHYIDPFKNRQVAYYIPAFAPNGLPVYVPYSEDHLLYASPPQTPAMSETSLSHQPQYPRTHPYGFPPPFPSRGQSTQRGRLPRRPEDGNVSPSTAFPGDHPPLRIITTTSTSRTSSPPPYLPPMKRRNSLPPNNKPNVAHVVKAVPKPEEYISSPSSVSQSLGASVSSMGAPIDSDGFAGDLDRRTSESDESADATDSTEVRTPRQVPIQPQTYGTGAKNDPTRSPSVAKESPTLPAGRSYAAALLNTAPPSGQPPAMKSPILTTTAKATPVVPITPITPITPTTTTDKDLKRNKMSGTKTPLPTSSSSETSPQSSKKSDRETSTPASSPLSSPIDSSKRPPSVWIQPPVQPAPFLTPAEPVVPVRRSSVQSTTPNVASPKKPNRATNGQSRKSSVITIPEPSTDGTPTSTTGKKHRKNKNRQAKKQNVGDANINGMSNHRRQSVIAQH